MATATTKTFEYSVRDSNGKVITGKLQTPTHAALVTKPRDRWYPPR